MVLNIEQKIENWDAFQVEADSELDQSQRALNEINLMLDQSQVELSKLAQRNTAITVHLQQVQAQLDSLPRSDIRMAYDAALDSTQRLAVMRGQLEKLQSDQQHLKRLIFFLDSTKGLIGGGTPEEPEKAGPATSQVAMLINAQESERQRLSRQMHDGPAQALSNFILQTEIAARLFEMDPTRAKEELANLKLAAMSTFQKVRNFIFELRPMMLDDLGLIPTIRKYSETFKDQSGLTISLAITGTESRLEPYLEVMIFRALQELLGNSARHAQATEVKVLVNNDDAFFKLSVEDNGKGFDVRELDKSECLGLHLIKERAELLAGSMIIDTKPGQGARITIEIPTVKNKTA
jgi:two-component system sensor histidine kinase DegS